MQNDGQRRCRDLFAAVAACVCILIASSVHPAASHGQNAPAEKEIIRVDEDEQGDLTEKNEQGTSGRRTDAIDEKKEREKPRTTTEEEGEDSVEEPKGVQFKFKGQVKNLYQFHRTNNFMGESPLTTSTHNLSSDLTRLRLSPEFRYRENFIARIDLDNEFIASNYGKSKDFTLYWRLNEYNDFLDLAWEPYRGREAYYRIKAHRAYVKVSKDWFTGTVGRQQIRFGSGKLWNPLDILNPVSPTFVEGGDEQKGTDAIRLDFYPDEKTELTAVIDFKKSNNKIERFNMRDCNYVGRVKTSIEDTDLAILGGYVSRRGVAGFDFAAILFGGMLRGSVMASQANDPYVTKDDPWYPARFMIPGKAGSGNVFFLANAGYEYSFKAGVYLLVEYFFNQRAINYCKDLRMAAFVYQINSTMDQRTYLQLSNTFLTVNQHYLSAAVGYDFHPLVRGDLFVIGDIQGRGIFWSPAIRVNAYENLDFIVGMMGSVTFNNKATDFAEFRKNYLFYASGAYVF